MTKVLIVDDNKNNRLTIRLLLEEYSDISIFEADNGKKGADTAKLTNPDIIFMDIMMPTMDGTEATRLIRSFNKECIIVAVSVLGDDVHKNSMLQAGAEDYITKPINEELFKARMKNYISIAEFRRIKERMDGVVNLFSEDIYQKKTSFTVASEAGLAEFWDSMMFISDNDNLCDSIRAIYNIGTYLLETNDEFQIIVEENDAQFFFSIISVKNFILQDIKNIFSKENPLASIAAKGYEISISLSKKLTLPQVVEKEKMSIDDSDKKILRMTHIEKISAVDFAKELEPDVVDKLDKLEYNEDKLDALIYELESQKDFDVLNKIATEVEFYSAEIDTLYEFKNLSYALLSLANFLKKLCEQEITDEYKKQKLTIIIRSIFEDLATWRKTIFIEQHTQDIHYLDSSLLSSCLQAELIFKDAALEEDDELELF
ncbi:MAG: response regulator [Campylobacterales bacterium]|nr:response regulator [Campylobacterales bacterium]